MDPLSPEVEAQLLRIKQEACRKGAPHHLLDFIQYRWPLYIPGRHHEYIARKLEQVERTITHKLRPGEKPLRRLILSVPPRHGKSELATINFPAWFLGRNPDMRVITAAYGQDLATWFSGQTRDILDSDEVRSLGWNPPAKGSKAKDTWEVEGHRGGLKACGRGSSVTGRGANLLIIDDPVRDAKEARSKLIQQSTLDWYDSTARTRLAPGGAVIIIQTRWDKSDLAGQMIARQEMGGKAEWEVINLPAIAEAGDILGRQVGEALWPDMYPVEEFLELMESDWWLPMFQGHPQDPAGTDFRREWFGTPIAWDKTYTEYAKQAGLTRLVRFWDCAAKVGEENDYTVGVLMGAGATVHRTVLDVVRDRMVFPVAKERIKQTAALDPEGTIIAIEDTSNGIALAQDLRADPEMQKYAIFNVPVTADKRVRAAPYASATKAGYTRLLAGKWNLKYLEEMCEFPLGEHDDQVDGSSGANSQLFGPAPMLASANEPERAEPETDMEKELQKTVERLPSDLLAHLRRITGGTL